MRCRASGCFSSISPVRGGPHGRYGAGDSQKMRIAVRQRQRCAETFAFQTGPLVSSPAADFFIVGPSDSYSPRDAIPLLRSKRFVARRYAARESDTTVIEVEKNSLLPAGRVLKPEAGSRGQWLGPLA